MLFAADRSSDERAAHAAVRSSIAGRRSPSRLLVFLLVCFLAPLLIMAVRSVTDLPAGSEGDPLTNFRRFFGGEANLRVLRNTFWIAGLSTLALPRDRLSRTRT